MKIIRYDSLITKDAIISSFEPINEVRHHEVGMTNDGFVEIHLNKPEESDFRKIRFCLRADRQELLTVARAVLTCFGFEIKSVMINVNNYINHTGNVQVTGKISCVVNNHNRLKNSIISGTEEFSSVDGEHSISLVVSSVLRIVKYFLRPPTDYYE